MYIIERDNLLIIPIDFNMFYIEAREYKRGVKYSKEYTISEKFIEELIILISKKKGNTFVLDMQNIVSYSPRLLSRLEKYLDSIVFYNVSMNSTINDKISTDLSNLKWLENGIAYYCEKRDYIIEAMIRDSCIGARAGKMYEILARLVDREMQEPKLLESSGLYSNCYVDIKRLFLDVDNFYFIIFLLAEKIAPYIGKIDAFVSSSKNGAIIANILGGLLDVKEVHLIGVGPKFSMELGDSIECIKKGKKYVYIFDFLCTGTELKIVSALINSKKAYLPYAAGIARYKKGVASYIVNKIDVLADTIDMGIDYKIVGESRELQE